MERKPLEEAYRKIAELEKSNRSIQYQFEEMFKESAQKSSEITELKVKIRAFESEMNEIKRERRERNRKEMANLNQSDDIIAVESDVQEEEDNGEVSNLFELPIQKSTIYEEEQGPPFNCNLCGKTYIQQKRLETHMNDHQNVSKTKTTRKRKSTQRKSKTDKDGNFVCNVKDCGYTTAFYAVLMRHQKAHTSKMHFCEFYMCYYKTPYEKRYTNHLYIKHGASKYKIENPQNEDNNQPKARIISDEILNMEI